MVHLNEPLESSVTLIIQITMVSWYLCPHTPSFLSLVLGLLLPSRIVCKCFGVGVDATTQYANRDLDQPPNRGSFLRLVAAYNTLVSDRLHERAILTSHPCSVLASELRHPPGMHSSC